MKRIFILFIVFISQQISFSQEIYKENKNGVTRYWSYAFETKINGGMLFSLNNFTENENSEYYIEARFFDLKERFNFPCYSKLLFETQDGTVIELTAQYAEINEEYDWPQALYLITTSQLESLFNGVRLIKIEILKRNGEKVDKIFTEKKLSKDKFGIYLKKSYEAIENKRRNM